MLRGRNSGSQAASLPSDVRPFLESLRPGQSVDLVLNPAGSRPLDVRRTLILEIDPQRGVVVSQPNRTVTRAIGAQRIDVTVLKRDLQSQAHTRIGFYATIHEFIDGYQLGSGSQEALVLALPREVHEANLRSSYRLVIPSSLTPPVCLLDEHEQKLDLSVEISNLSSGGALVSYRRSRRAGQPFRDSEALFLEVDLGELVERLAVRLYASQSERARFRTRCRVAHTAEESDTQRDYVGLSFLDPTRQQQDLLHAVILKMQMFISSRGLT
jgi:hypothetical protein